MANDALRGFNPNKIMSTFNSHWDGGDYLMAHEAEELDHAIFGSDTVLCWLVCELESGEAASWSSPGCAPSGHVYSAVILTGSLAGKVIDEVDYEWDMLGIDAEGDGQRALEEAAEAHEGAREAAVQARADQVRDDAMCERLSNR